MSRLRSISIATATLALALACGSHSASAETARDVPSGHWAYAAVQDLAAKGLIGGYPPDGNFFGGRTVTRYEMASIIDRVLTHLQNAPASALSEAQRDEVRRLIDEYKVELTVIGSRLDALQKDVDTLKAQASSQQADIDTAKQDATEARQGVQSALDAVLEQSRRVDKLNSSKVDAGFGKIKMGGLLQIWAGTGDNLFGTGVDSSLRLRRSELKFTGNINPSAYWTAMIDPARSLSLNTVSSGGNVTAVSVNAASNVMQDLVLGYKLSPSLALELGQQKVPMSMEGLWSSAKLLTIERSLMNSLPINNGRVGDIRDAGLMLRYTGAKAEAQAGFFNDAGNRQNQVDDNSKKEFIYHVQYKALGPLLVGAYQEISGGVNGARETKRKRLGFEGALDLGKHYLQAEVARAEDNEPAVRAEGGYLMNAYQMNPTWQAVVRGDYWNPNRDLKGDLKNTEQDLTLGLNYLMTGHNSKIQFNYTRKNTTGPMSAAGTGPAALPSLGKDRSQYLLNFQQSF
jgi:hypothetical protein